MFRRILRFLFRFLPVPEGFDPNEGRPVIRSIVMLFDALPIMEQREVEAVLKAAFGPDARIEPYPGPGEVRWGYVFQIGGEAFGVLAVEKRYDYAATPEGTDPAAAEAFRRHRSWIAVDHLPQGRPDSAFAFNMIGRVIAEIAERHPPMALATPTYERIAAWSPEMPATLRGEEPRAVFGPGPYRAADETVLVPTDEAAMEAAVAEARRRMPEFLDAFAKRKRGDMFMVKSPFPCGDDGGNEHMWLSVTAVEGDNLVGKLEVEPFNIKTLKKGSRVTVVAAEISDWAIVREGQEPIGLFTDAIVERGNPK